MPSTRVAVEASKLQCYCDSGKSFADCCAPIINRELAAANPEHLMRSRYSAFCCGDTTYLRSSWHESTRPSKVSIDPEQRWIKLKILSTGEADEVEFVATFKLAGRAHKIHERSRFCQENGDWFYIDGVHL